MCERSMRKKRDDNLDVDRAKYKKKERKKDMTVKRYNFKGRPNAMNFPFTIGARLYHIIISHSLQLNGRKNDVYEFTYE